MAFFHAVLTEIPTASNSVATVIVSPANDGNPAQLEYGAFVRERVAEVRQRIDAARSVHHGRADVVLVAVTKTHPANAVLAAWNAGVLDVGENKVDVLTGFEDGYGLVRASNLNDIESGVR